MYSYGAKFILGIPNIYGITIIQSILFIKIGLDVKFKKESC